MIKTIKKLKKKLVLITIKNILKINEEIDSNINIIDQYEEELKKVKDKSFTSIVEKEQVYLNSKEKFETLIKTYEKNIEELMINIFNDEKFEKFIFKSFRNYAMIIYFGKFDHKITKKDKFFYFDLVKFFIKSIGESMYCIDKMGDLMFQEMNKDIDPLLCELGVKAKEYKITKKQLDLFFETCYLYIY